MKGWASRTITADLSATHTDPVTVDLGISGTATATEDYTVSQTQIIIAVGETTGSVSVSALQDNIEEPDETVIVDILNVTNGRETETQQVTTTILDDDSPTTFQVTGLTSTSTGFVAELGASLDPSVLSVYDTQTAEWGPPDVILEGSTVGVVPGSLIVDSSLPKGHVRQDRWASKRG